MAISHLSKVHHSPEDSWSILTKTSSTSNQLASEPQLGPTHQRDLFTVSLQTLLTTQEYNSQHDLCFCNISHFLRPSFPDHSIVSLKQFSRNAVLNQENISYILWLEVYFCLLLFDYNILVFVSFFTPGFECQTKEVGKLCPLHAIYEG